MVDHIKQAIIACQRRACMHALFFVDIDDYKSINDTLGHDHGDRLLQQIATVSLCGARRATPLPGLAAMVVLLLLNLSEDMTTAAAQAENIGKKILSTLRMPLQLESINCRCSGSIGLTLFGDKPVTVDEVLKQADLAMYL